jgi:hypothetical protein
MIYGVGHRSNNIFYARSNNNNNKILTVSFTRMFWDIHAHMMHEFIILDWAGRRGVQLGC